MKKIVSVLLIITLSLGLFNGYKVVHADLQPAETIDWQPVVLPNGEYANTTFSDGLDHSIWSRDDDEDYIVDDYGLFMLPQDKSPIIYQNFDYNAGTLKSDYYKFELEMYINQDDAGNDITQHEINTGGLAVVSNLNTARSDADQTPSDGTLKNSILIFEGETTIRYRYRRRWYEYLAPGSEATSTIGNLIEESDEEFNENWDIYKHVIIMKRVDDTNEFDVEHIIYKDNDVFTYTGKYTTEHIYPMVYAYKNQKAKLISFKASSVPQALPSVSISALRQKGDQLIVGWSDVSLYFDRVKIAWGNSANVDFADDSKVLFDGLSTDLSEVLPLPQDNNFHIAIQAYTGHLTSEIQVMEFKPILPVENVTYRNSGIETGYIWEAADDAVKYDLRIYDTTLLTEPTDLLFASLENILNADIVDVIALKPALVGGGYSESAPSGGTYLPIGAVENLVFTTNNTTINFDWDDKDDADLYRLYKTIAPDTFVLDPLVITNSDAELSMNTNFVTNSYKVTAMVDGIESDESNLVEVPNKVLGVNALLQGGIFIEWQAIGDAEGYNVYVSNDITMSNQDVYTTSNLNYFLTLPAIAEDRYIQVQAFKGGAVTEKSDIRKVDLTSVGVVVGSNVSMDIVGSEGFDLTSKHYETPMTMEYSFTIGANELEYPIIEIPLTHIPYPDNSGIMMSYIYPEVGDIVMTGHGSLKHLISIQSNGDEGYVIRIQFTEPDTTDLFITGRTITVPIKTDLIFNEVENGSKSILYVSPSNLYSWTQLHLFIEERWIALAVRLGLGATESQALIEANKLLNLEAKIFYNRSGTTVEEEDDFYFEFKNRNEIPTQ